MKINKKDIFKIGNHIVACGDSLDKEFVEKVIGNNKIRSIVTDPPYGVAYVENKKGFAKLGVKDEKIIPKPRLNPAAIITNSGNNVK